MQRYGRLGELLTALKTARPKLNLSLYLFLILLENANSEAQITELLSSFGLPARDFSAPEKHPWGSEA